MRPYQQRLAIICSLLCLGSTPAQAARDYISIVGSSTVYPFTTAVAEYFGRVNTKFKTPKVEATGSGGGIKLFCSGIGIQYPDIVNASRPIKTSELANCAAHGVREIVEIKVGLDGIVIASSNKSPALPLTLKDLWLALAKQVPDAESGRLIANPSKTWHDVNPNLPKQKIEILGPPPTSGTRDAFVEMVMDHGCKQVDALKTALATDTQATQAICRTIREDGAFIEAGENDNLIVNKLVANRNALGIFGFSFLEENLDKIRGQAINGIAPDFENIANGTYVVSRPLFIYVKKKHVDVIPGIREFIAEFTSERAVGAEGYLSNKGLIPLPDAERHQVATEANALTVLER